MSLVDEKDIEILAILKKDSKITIQHIATETSIPVTTVHNRIKRMEENNIIKGYSAIVDDKRLGVNIKAYVMINVEYRTPTGKKISQTELARKIKKSPLVDEASILAGGTDILIKIHSRSMEELNDFIINRLRDMDGVLNTQTMVVLSEVE